MKRKPYDPQAACPTPALDSEGRHSYQLEETGYIRTWSTTIDPAGKIKAFYGGSEDFSLEGNGEMYLACAGCFDEFTLPPHAGEIDYI